MENKYLVFMIQNAHDFLTYRLRLFITVLNQFAMPLVMLFILSNLPGKAVAGASKQQLTYYFILTAILYLFTNSDIDSFVKEAIQQGELATYLIKPVHFWLVALSRDLSQRLLKLVLGIPVFIILLIFYFNSLHLPSYNNLPLTLLTLTLSFLLSFAISFTVGLLAFWLEEVWGVQNLKRVAILFLGGAALPYYFFPAYLQKILIYTPFPYLVNWSIRKGFSGNLLIELSSASFWLLFFSILNFYLWKTGLKKYSALGTY